MFNLIIGNIFVIVAILFIVMAAEVTITANFMLIVAIYFFMMWRFDKLEIIIRNR